MWPYLLLSAISEPLWRFGVARRVRRGKEDASRAPEKFGYASAGRPDGELIWFHALSVGECLALMALLRRLGESLPEAHFLLTSNTRASLRATDAAGLPPRVIHQYAPVDAPGPVRRFLRQWQPDVAVYSELDLWPRLIRAARQRGMPQMLINSRMSAAQAASRRKYRWLFRRVLDCFGQILLQDDASLPRFLRLGADPDRTIVVGSLKGAGDPLPDKPEERSMIANMIGARPVWLAAATEAREEERLFEAHVIARQIQPDLLMIIAPRNPGEAATTVERANRRFDRVAQRTKSERITPEIAVYVADTFGEMGLWYRLCPVSFVGHSLDLGGEPLPGKNPYEAALLRSMILHGSSVTHFADNYADLGGADATVEVNAADEIAAAVVQAQDTEWRAPYLSAAQDVVQSSKSALETTLSAILNVRSVR